MLVRADCFPPGRPTILPVLAAPEIPVQGPESPRFAGIWLSWAEAKARKLRMKAGREPGDSGTREALAARPGLESDQSEVSSFWMGQVGLQVSPGTRAYSACTWAWCYTCP